MIIIQAGSSVLKDAGVTVAQGLSEIIGAFFSFVATVTGVFCDGWVIPDSNFFFCEGVGCSGVFCVSSRGFFATVLGFFATVLAAEVFLGVSQHSTVEEEEKESRRMRSRGGGGGA